MSTIDEYLQNVSSDRRQYLQNIRRLVHEMAPDVQESISYQIPTFKLNGHRLLYFAAFKNHLSIYPASDGMVKAVAGLDKFRTATGTLQVKLDNPLTEEQIKAIIRYRLENLTTN